MKSAQERERDEIGKVYICMEYQWISYILMEPFTNQIPFNNKWKWICLTIFGARQY